MAYLAPLVRGFVSFVNRLTNATEPELGARLTRARSFAVSLGRLTGLTKPEQGVPPPATPGRTFSPHGHGTNRATTSPGWRVDRGGRLSCPVTIYHSMICTRTPYHATQVRRMVRRAQSGGAAAERPKICRAGRTSRARFGRPRAIRHFHRWKVDRVALGVSLESLRGPPRAWAMRVGPFRLSRPLPPSPSLSITALKP